MRLFHIRYDGYNQPVFASNHEAARRLGVCALVKQLHVVDLDKVAVIDGDIAAGYQRGMPLSRAAPHADADLFRDKREGWLHV